jgi:hypothetical protein
MRRLIAGVLIGFLLASGIAGAGGFQRHNVGRIEVGDTVKARFGPEVTEDMVCMSLEAYGKPVEFELNGRTFEKRKLQMVVKTMAPDDCQAWQDRRRERREQLAH